MYLERCDIYRRLWTVEIAFWASLYFVNTTYDNGSSLFLFIVVWNMVQWFLYQTEESFLQLECKKSKPCFGQVGCSANGTYLDVFGRNGTYSPPPPPAYQLFWDLRYLRVWRRGGGGRESVCPPPPPPPTIRFGFAPLVVTVQNMIYKLSFSITFVNNYLILQYETVCFCYTWHRGKFSHWCVGVSWATTS